MTRSRYAKTCFTKCWGADHADASALVTLQGVREFFLIAFLHVGTRKVFVTKATDHPTADWVKDQAEAFGSHVATEGLKAEYVFRDRDSKLGGAFDAPLTAQGITVQRTPIRAPNMNAFVERWIQSIQTECLDHQGEIF